MIGVAPLAFTSAIILRTYQPKVWIVSCFFVMTLSISVVSSPMPGREPRERHFSRGTDASSLTGLASLCPN